MEDEIQFFINMLNVCNLSDIPHRSLSLDSTPVISANAQLSFTTQLVSSYFDS